MMLPRTCSSSPPNAWTASSQEASERFSSGLLYAWRDRNSVASAGGCSTTRWTAAARKLPDPNLSTMDMDLRTTFVLFELEGLSTPEIAQLAEIPLGTAASRLRRAREHFRESVAHYESEKKTTVRSST